jgi:acyl-CoA thioester hydrolase
MVSRIEMHFKTPLRGGEECDVCLNVKKEGVRYIFLQDIVRVSDGKLAVAAEVECVALHENRIAKETPYDDAMKPYYTV